MYTVLNPFYQKLKRNGMNYNMNNKVEISKSLIFSLKGYSIIVFHD